MRKSKKNVFFLLVLILLYITTVTYFSSHANADTSDLLRSYINGHGLLKSPHENSWHEGSNRIFVKRISNSNYKMYINGVPTAHFLEGAYINGSYQWDGNTAVFFLIPPPAGLYATEGMVVFKKNGHIFFDTHPFNGGFCDPFIMRSSPRALRIRIIDSGGGGTYRYYRYALNDNSVTRYETKMVHVTYRYISAETVKPIYLRGRIIRKEVNNEGKKQYEAILLLDPGITFYNGTFYFPKNHITIGQWNASKYGQMVKSKNSWFQVEAECPEDFIIFDNIQPALIHPRSPGLYKVSDNH